MKRTYLQDEANTHYNLGIAYYTKGQYELAISEWIQSLIKNPQNGEARFKLGVAYYQLNRIDEALKEWEMAVQLDPRNFEVLHNLGIAYYNKGDD